MKWLILLILLAASLEAWFLRERVEVLCHFTHSLARLAPEVDAWLVEANREPFLGERALDGPPATLITALRSRARLILSEFSAPLVPKPALWALQKLALADDRVALGAALENLPLGLKAFECRRSQARDEDPELNGAYAAANAYWSARKAQVPAEKAAFANDSLIYCKDEALLARLKGLLAVAARKCRQAKPGTKMALACTAGKTSAAVNAEMQDVLRQRGVNDRKLRQKWPKAVMDSLGC